MVTGELFANVWPSDEILIISPQTGRVTGRIDLSRPFQPAARIPPMMDVLNGIADDAGRDRFFITGHMWPRLFEIPSQRPPSR